MTRCGLNVVPTVARHRHPTNATEGEPGYQQHKTKWPYGYRRYRSVAGVVSSLLHFSIRSRPLTAISSGAINGSNKPDTIPAARNGTMMLGRTMRNNMLQVSFIKGRGFVCGTLQTQMQLHFTFPRRTVFLRDKSYLRTLRRNERRESRRQQSDGTGEAKSGINEISKNRNSNLHPSVYVLRKRLVAVLAAAYPPGIRYAFTLKDFFSLSLFH